MALMRSSKKVVTNLPFGLKAGEGIFTTQIKSGRLPASPSEKWGSFGNGFALCNVSNINS